MIDHFKPFNRQACDLCGLCFHLCPVMQLDEDEAMNEIARLIAGHETRHVLQKCTACFACDLICPNECNPTALIIERWHEQIVQQGLPLRAGYFVPTMKANFRTYVVDRLPVQDKALLKQWEDASPCEEVFYPGCNWITQPHLSRTSLLDGLSIRGTLDLCCGETLYRTGLYEEARRQGRKVVDYYNDMGVNLMVIPCAAGLNMFTNVLPKVYGIEPKFEVQHLLSWLMGKIDYGRIRLGKIDSMKVTIQESCYSKLFGKDFMDLPRRLLDMMGINVVEESLCRDKALCCGIGGGFSPSAGYHPINITLSGIKSLQMARATKADALAVYCAGCLQMLSLAQIAYPVPFLPIYHILELLQMAIGEVPQRKHMARAWTTLLGVARNQLPALLSGKRIYLG
ncbi:MAG: (Fe-S)-binding protein [Deltaproteobacteria bacterium]|nr:(Fe-S)-binding protein [Deltaproteobacteria bacterium]